MSYSLPKYYFRDIPAYMMDEIIAGMIEGKTEPTPEEMEEWLASELQRDAEILLNQVGIGFHLPGIDLLITSQTAAACLLPFKFVRTLINTGRCAI